jgi:hypothetical protein
LLAGTTHIHNVAISVNVHWAVAVFFIHTVHILLLSQEVVASNIFVFIPAD